MTNQVKAGTPQNNRFYPCPSAVTAGMAVLIGTQAGVAIDDYDANTGGTTFCLDGSYTLTVTGQSTKSPNSIQAIKTGAELYASGTYDSTTNITYSLTIDATNGNCPFGNLESGNITAGVADANAVVRLKIGGSPGPYAP